MTQFDFSQRLLEWFDHSGRKDLPWQHDITPYHVWLSEIMLQQTQVSTVIDYYRRFIACYPTIQDLAAASIDDVLALWTGLGYYARARNLHASAQIVVADYQGQMPDDLANLMALPGIGRSTAGAILSLAYHQRFPILDGNVKRVLCRYRAIEGWPGKKQIEQQLWTLAEDLLPKTRIANYIQAQMDLGATICTRTKPRCTLCPLQSDCTAFAMQKMTDFPHKKAKKTPPLRQTFWLIAQQKSGKILLEQRVKKGIWGGLWSFPEFDSHAQLSQYCQTHIGSQPLKLTADNTIRHIFTHYKLDILPFLVHSSICDQLSNTEKSWNWFKTSDALQLGLPAPVKAYISTLE